ncbi:MAG: prepilin peptidase [Thermodesulfobacteriota bacterium]
MHDAVAITLASVLAAAVVADLRARRIPNLLTLPACLGFLLLRLVLFGPEGFVAGLAGLGLGLGLMLPAYGLGVMGGGDAKLMAAVGAALGPAGVLWSFLFTSVFGGAYALAVLLFRPAGRAALRRALAGLAGTALALRAGGGLHYAAPAPERTLPRLCYGLAIAAGTSLYLFLALTRAWIFA